MANHQLLLLGPPGITVGGAALRLDRKPLALLAWLALAEGPVSRGSLADLLWPDSSQPGVNLRKALTEIRVAVGGMALTERPADRTLALGPGLTVDACAFEEALAEVAAHGHADDALCAGCVRRLSAAIALWRGDFLAGFQLPDSPDFDDWRTLHAQRLASQRIGTLDLLAMSAAAVGDWRNSLKLAAQRLALDLLDEAGHRRLARLLAWSGQRSGALRQLEACATALSVELGIAPSAETKALEADIRAERLALPPAPSDPSEPGGRIRGAMDHSDRSSPSAGQDGRAPSGAGDHRVLSSAQLPFSDRVRVLDAQGADGLSRTMVGRGRRDARRDLPPVPPTLRAAQGRLLAAVLHPEARADLDEDSLAALAALPPVDLTTYRLSRVAAWSRPHFSLDRSFVSLTLLVDRGSERRRRWQTSADRYEDLRGLLAAVEDPALVLLGRPGAGKSTLLRRLELDVSVDGLRGTSDIVPFLVPLNAYRLSAGRVDGPAPAAWLAERWRQRHPMLPAMEDLLAEGRMLLLLDGLNEMPCPDDAGRLDLVARWREWLQDLMERWRGNRVLFTCRGLDYSAPLSSPRLPVPQVRLEPLTDGQIRALVTGLGGEAALEALERLILSRDWNLLRTPYALRLLVEQLQAGESDMPDWIAMQVGVLRRALRRELERGNPCLAVSDDEAGGALFTARDRRRMLQTTDWSDPYGLPEDGRLFERLGRLAWLMQAGRPGGDSGQVRIRYADAVAALDDPAADRILRAGHALGLIEDDAARDELAFSHQLLQEHFAARRLAATGDLAVLAVPWRSADIKPGLDETLAQLGRADPLPPAPGSGWEETALQAVVLSRDPNGFIAGLREVDLALAGRCAARLRAVAEAARRAEESPDSARSLDRDLVSRLRWALVERSRDPAADLRARIAAGLALGELGDPRLTRRRGADGDCLVPMMVSMKEGSHQPGADDDGAGSLVALPAFAIAATELTNAEWSCFMAGGGYEDPRWWDTVAAREWQRGLTTADDTRAQARVTTARFRRDPAELERLYAEGHMPSDWHAIFRERIALDEAGLEAHLVAMYPEGRLRAPRFWDDPAFNNPAQPVVGISWFEARAYTLWLAAQTGEPFRLLGELEWEAAARGTGSGTRQGADEATTPLVNTSEVHVWRPSPVGVFPEGDTSEDVMDLLGNVWEWTSSIFGADRDYPTYTVPRATGTEAAAEDPAAPPGLRRVARGGAWDSPRVVASSRVRDAVLPGGRDAGYGMRLGWG